MIWKYHAIDSAQLIHTLIHSFRRILFSSNLFSTDLLCSPLRRVLTKYALRICNPFALRSLIICIISVLLMCHRSTHKFYLSSAADFHSWIHFQTSSKCRILHKNLGSERRLMNPVAMPDFSSRIHVGMWCHHELIHSQGCPRVTNNWLLDTKYKI